MRLVEGFTFCERLGSYGLPCVRSILQAMVQRLRNLSLILRLYFAENELKMMAARSGQLRICIDDHENLNALMESWVLEVPQISGQHILQTIRNQLTIPQLLPISFPIGHLWDTYLLNGKTCSYASIYGSYLAFVE